MEEENDILYTEGASLTREDCFLVTQRRKAGYFSPMHVHAEYQLNYLENVSGALRIVDQSVEELDNYDLVLVAGGLKHAYVNHKCKSDNITEITIKFHRSLFDSLINRRHFISIRDMLENASRGLVFSSSTVAKVKDDLKLLANAVPGNFSNFLKLLEIVKTISQDTEARRLSTKEAEPKYNKYDTDRLESIMLYLQKNYQYPILLSDLASLINMSESSLTRFLRKWTGKTFIDNLNDIRISEAINKLIDTSDSVSEICYKCGFNNISNFNRAFKKLKGVTPTEFRQYYARTRFRV